MKKLLILLALTISMFSVEVFAQAQPKTVTDYFLAFPADLYSRDSGGNVIKSKAALQKFRRSLIKVEDVKNGYLKLEGDWEGWAEVALFKKKDGSYLVGHIETGCGPVCGGDINFYTYKAGKWTNVTDKVFPKLSEAQVKQAFLDNKIDIENDGLSYYFVLPQKGTTVRMECNLCESGNAGDDFALMEFAWDGEKFSIKK